MRFRVIALATYCLSSAAAAAQWAASVDSRSGLPMLSKGGDTALSSAFAFWGKNWTWANQSVQFKVIGPFTYSIAGHNPTLNFDLAGVVIEPADRQLAWQIDLNAHAPATGIVGGGIVFTFDLANFGPELGEPELLPGNMGWAWGHADRCRIELRFDRPLAAIYFEGGRKSELRAFLLKDEILPGTQRLVATMRLSGDVALRPSSPERFGMEDPTTWAADILTPDASPVDLSFLNASNKPAGKRGFLKARGDELVFDDGTPARFWGTNLTSNALFLTPKDDVRRQARRISQLGFNLVRLHHHDSEWVSPNIFGDRSSPDTRQLSAESLEKLDWWIKCLEDEGIYVWLDLQVGRRAKRGDGIDNFEELRQGRPSAGLTGYNYVNASIRAAMKQFDQLYLDHQNRFTGLSYKDDPSIVTVLISNENDITHHFGNALLPDKGVPAHSAIYLHEAEAFAAKFSLPKDSIWRAWEDGPSKIFLNDLEERFDADMISYLRALGVRVPIVTTSTWGSNPLSSLPALTVGDSINVHSYGGVGELEKNPQFGANLVDWVAAARVVGKPLTVTEWGVDDHGELSPDRQDIPLYIAGSAAMQGWSAVMFYAYSQEALSSNGGTPSIYHAYNDPALMSSLPAAALLYRRGHVSEATTRYVFAPSKDLLFDHAISAATSVALRTAAERGKLAVAMPRVPELPWLSKSAIPAGAQVLSDPLKSSIPMNASEIVSDSGELTRNWDRGTFTIDTPRTQSAMGWIGGNPIRLANLEVQLSTRNGVVAVQSLDENPIRESRAIMISLGARSVPSTPRSLPFYSEPMRGRFSFSAPPGLALSVWDAHASKMRRIAPPPYVNGRYVLTVDKSLSSGWLILTPDASHRPLLH